MGTTLKNHHKKNGLKEAQMVVQKSNIDYILKTIDTFAETSQFSIVLIQKVTIDLA